MAQACHSGGGGDVTLLNASANQTDRGHQVTMVTLQSSTRARNINTLIVFQFYKLSNNSISII